MSSAADRVLIKCCGVSKHYGKGALAVAGGLAPAWRAASVRPAEVLRCE